MTVMERLEPIKPEIIALYMSGVGTTKICKLYDANHKFIYNIIKESGVPIRRRHGTMQENNDKILELFNQEIPINEISKQLNLPNSSVHRYLQNLGKDTSKYSTQREVRLRDFADEIVHYYQSGLGCTTISHIYDCAEISVLKILWENNVDTTFVPIWEYDWDFFETINTEIKAWCLGVWYTDGNNSKYNARVSMTDRDIIDKIKIAINYNGPVFTKIPRQETHKEQYIINLCGKRIGEQLTKAGCMPNKTFLLNFPSEDILPRHLQRHFIRGCIDGDGTVGSYVGLCGASPMLLQFPELVKTYMNVDFSYYNNQDDAIGGICHSQRLTRREDIEKFLHWIYDDATIYGDRKYANALAWYSKHRVGDV